MEERILQVFTEIKKELQDIRSILELKEIEKFKYVSSKIATSEVPKPSIARSIENSKGFFALTIWMGVLILMLIKAFS